MANKTLILDEQKIALKLQRMAYQIWETNSAEKELVIAGVEGAGTIIAAHLARYLKDISPLKITEITIVVNKKQPLHSPDTLAEDVSGKTVVLVDDVANSGRTLLYAIRPLLRYELKKIMVAVLIDRTHKSFPVSPDIVGHALATTLQEHVEVECKGQQVKGVFLM